MPSKHAKRRLAARKQRQAASGGEQAASSRVERQAAASDVKQATSASSELQQRIDAAYAAMSTADQAAFVRDCKKAGLPVPLAASEQQASTSDKRQQASMRTEVATAITMLRYYNRLCGNWPLSAVDDAVWAWRDQQLDVWTQQAFDLLNGNPAVLVSGELREQATTTIMAAEQRAERRRQWDARLQAKAAAAAAAAASKVRVPLWQTNPVISGLLQQAKEEGCKRYQQAGSPSDSIASMLAGLAKMHRVGKQQATSSASVRSAMAGILAMRRDEASPDNGEQQEPTNWVRAAATSEALRRLEPAAGPASVEQVVAARQAASKVEQKAPASGGPAYADFKLELWASMAVFWQAQVEQRWSAFAAERLSRCGMQMQHWDFVRRQQKAA